MKLLTYCCPLFVLQMTRVQAAEKSSLLKEAIVTCLLMHV